MFDVSGWVLPVSKPSSTCFLTLMCLCLIRTRAWWIDLASPSLNTYGTKGVKIKFLARKSNSHLGLEPALEEVLDLEAEHVVQLHPVVPEDTGPHQPPAGDTVQNLSRWGMTFLDQELFSHLRRAFPSKSLLGAFSSRVRRSLAADLILARLYFTLHTCQHLLSYNPARKHILKPPRSKTGNTHLPLVPQAVLSNKLELLVEPGLLERPPGCAEHLGVLHGAAVVRHREAFSRCLKE